MGGIAAAVLAACAAPLPTPEQPAEPLAGALLARGAHPALGPAMNLYGRFVGHWDVAVTNFPDDGPPREAKGEWIFGWALEGRAIQDVWIVPARAARDPRAIAPGPIGTTLRFPETGKARWQVIWANPVSNTVERMTAREVGGEIVQEGRDSEGQPFRWIFHDITPDAFRWKAEQPGPDGRWRVRQAMVVTRRGAGAPP